MSGFWGLSDGSSAADTPKEYEVPSGNIEPIPNNSDVMALIDQAKWVTKESGERLVELRWTIMAPESVKNRKVFHKLWVDSLDPNAKDNAKAMTKRDKARRMLAAIDANAGSNLTRLGTEPTDEQMMIHLANVPMVIKLMVWSMKGSDGSDMMGNWISAVKPKESPLNVSNEKLPVASAPPAPSGGSGNSDIDDDDIPF